MQLGFANAVVLSSLLLLCAAHGFRRENTWTALRRSASTTSKRAQETYGNSAAPNASTKLPITGNLTSMPFSNISKILPPAFLTAVKEIRKVEESVEGLDKKMDRLTNLVLAAESSMRNATESLTRTQKGLYASEHVVRSNEWALGKSQISFSESNASLGSEDYDIKLTQPQIKNVSGSATTLASNANATAKPADLVALENLEKTLWDVTSPKGKLSLDVLNQRLLDDEKDAKDFHKNLALEVKKVLGKSGRPLLNAIRKEMFHLAEASYGMRSRGSEEEEEEDDKGNDNGLANRY